MAITLQNTPGWGAAAIQADATITLAAHAAGDRMYLFASWKPYDVTCLTPAGWTEVYQGADGTLAPSVGTGSIRIAVFYKDAAGPSETNPLLDFSAAIIGFATHYILRKAAGETWDTPLSAQAAWPGASTTETVSQSTPTTTAVPSGAMVMALIGLRDDSSTFTRPTTGINNSTGAITWNGNYVEAPATHGSTTLGQDGAADMGYRLVTTGATGTLQVTATISAVETGNIVWVAQGVSVAGTTVTPGTAALTLATFAPTVLTPVVATPPVAALTLTAFAPQASVGINVVPPTAALVLSAFAPVVTATQHVVVTPPTAALVITPLAPTVTATAHQTVTPTTLALVTATFAPSVTVGADIVVTPPTVGLVTVTFAPLVTASNHQTVTPGVAALATSLFAPTVTVSNNQTVVVGVAALATTRFAPTVTASNHQTVVPPTAALSLATLAPTVTAGANVTVTVSVAALTLSTFAPVVSVGVSGVLVPGVASLILTTLAPTITVAPAPKYVPGGPASAAWSPVGTQPPLKYQS